MFTVIFFPFLGPLVTENCNRAMAGVTIQAVLEASEGLSDRTISHCLSNQTNNGHCLSDRPLFFSFKKNNGRQGV